MSFGGFLPPTLQPPYRDSFEPSRLKTIRIMFIDRVLRFQKVVAQNWFIISWGFIVREDKTKTILQFLY